MGTVEWFQLVEFVLLVLFATAISDIRRKDHMTPTVGRGWLILLKAIYLVPLVIYGGTLVSLAALGWYDAVGLGLTAVGTFLAVRAKIDLGQQHAWAGYHRDHTQVVTHGIYAYVRHPIYSGILFFIAGGMFTSLPRASMMSLVVGSAAIAYIVGFLTLAARRESSRLTVVHGEAYGEYAKQVHSFLPVRKYRKAA